ncbi:hypothetical protein F2Q69_00031336 [Brassica cretica]|uniref:Uncharacterized protein n=1 Tax=Brassica cretica TaxID=69181 RepID=A0A8S9SCT2_BRACR|nr:hypothetical protein F2Q69_00031336 [Brassica cretica]
MGIEDTLNLRWNRVVFEVSFERLWESLKNPFYNPDLTQAILEVLRSLDRLQSYIAYGGPLWLSSIILGEANATTYHSLS